MKLIQIYKINMDKDIKKKKLRVLCLHGYNTDKDIMKYQLNLFSEIFKDVIELYFIDAPNFNPEERVKVFVDRGFTNPGRTWY
jgi:hypothetical protein